MKLKKKLIGLFSFTLVLLTCVLSVPITSFAYNDDEYKNKDGYFDWKMNNTHGNNQHVYLYILCDNDLNYSTYKFKYKFNCYFTEDNIPEAYKKDDIWVAEFYVPILCQTQEPIGEVSVMKEDKLISYNVYRYKMSVEPGVYTFDSNTMDFATLTQGLYTYKTDGENPCFYTDEDIYNGYSEVSFIGENDNAFVFTMLGDSEFLDNDQIIRAYSKWAEKTKNESAIENVITEKDSEKLLVYGEEDFNASKEFARKKGNIADYMMSHPGSRDNVKPTPEPTVEPIPEVVIENPGRDIQVSEPIVVEPIETRNEKKSFFIPIMLGMAVLIGGIVLVVIKLRR